MTPEITVGRPSRTTVVPTIAGSAPKRLRQSSWERTARSASAGASRPSRAEAAKGVPSSGATPRTAKKAGVTAAPWRRAGSPSPVRAGERSSRAARAEKEELSRRQSATFWSEAEKCAPWGVVSQIQTTRSGSG